MDALHLSIFIATIVGNLILKLGNASLLATHQHKKDINVLTPFQENCLSMDVTFFETTPYFDNNHLQGESERKDSCVGDVFQIKPEPPVLVEFKVLLDFTPDHPIPSALENQDITTTDQHLNQDTATIDQHLNQGTAATDQHLNQGRDIFKEKKIQLYNNSMSPTQVQIRTLLVPQMSCQVNFLWCHALLSPSLSQ